ncbi:hypothetical protein BT96DRAFT_961004 [Gymnopus androsaceus JB14]|uniref:Uncharacterized protein n=1 Tax=Gymnopus androsaceus JB14 TaxID=1447944 RepID=A0A6A4GE09_9AGAR|nr:hypothetical protein BT96DRAFT_961004 [Gymnopus androsaceus JB14]
MSWWCFPFKQLIGVIQKINTNDHKGGEMEATIMKTMARTANIRCWLRRSDCPDAVRLLKGLFDRCFIPVNGTDNSDEFVQRKGTHCAYVAHDGGKLSPFDTHKGNSTIIYRPFAFHPEGQNTGVRLHVRPHEPLSKALHDPFLKYPHFNARTYSSTLREAEDIIELDDVVSPAARYDYSYGRSVLVSLSRQ